MRRKAVVFSIEDNRGYRYLNESSGKKSIQISGEVFALLRRLYFRVQKRRQSKDLIEVVEIVASDDGSVKMRFSRLKGMTEIVTFWKPVHSPGKALHAISVERVARLRTLGQDYRVVHSWTLPNSVLALVYSEADELLSTHWFPRGFDKRVLPPSLFSYHPPIPLAESRSFVSASFCPVSNVLVFAIIPFDTSWDRPNSGGCRIVAVVLEDFSRESKQKVERDLSDTCSLNDPVGFRFGGLLLNDDGNIGVMTLSQGPDARFVIFQSRNLIRISTIPFNWPIAGGMQSPANFNQSLLLDRRNSELFPLNFRGTTIEFGFMSSLRQPVVAHLVGHFQDGGFQGISFDHFEIEGMKVDQGPHRLCCLLECQGSHQLLMLSSPGKIGIHFKAGSRPIIESVKFDIPRLFVDSIAEFGLAEIWRMSHADSMCSPKELLSLIVQTSREMFEAAELVKTLEETSQFSVLLAIYPRGSKISGSLPNSTVRCLMKILGIPKRVDKFPNFPWLRMTSHLPCFALSVVSLDGASLLSCLTGIEFVRPPVETWMIGSTVLPSGSDSILNVVANLFTT
jgi:hypothetical protein